MPASFRPKTTDLVFMKPMASIKSAGNYLTGHTLPKMRDFHLKSAPGWRIFLWNNDYDRAVFMENPLDHTNLMYPF